LRGIAIFATSTGASCSSSSPSDPAFPAAFPWFGTSRYWQDRILELREQLAAMSEPPIEIP
jgi:Ser/Thr protein kinase RdoA (MazF antagonist)